MVCLPCSPKDALLIGCIWLTTSNIRCTICPSRHDPSRLMPRQPSQMQYLGTYSNDWCDGAALKWDSFFFRFKDKPGVRFLEIGSYEGKSAVNMIKRYLTGEGSVMTCIDTFEGSMEHGANEKNGLYSRFINNVIVEGVQDKVDVKVGRSDVWLPKLVAGGERYDAVYIDGSHTSADVITDACLAMLLLKQGGVLLFDDYQWVRYHEPELNPRLAIDSFLLIFKGRVQVMYTGMQVALLKL